MKINIIAIWIIILSASNIYGQGSSGDDLFDDSFLHEIRFENADFDMATEYGYHSLFGENQPSLKTFIKERGAVVQQGLTDLGYSCQVNSMEETDKSDPFKVFPNPANSSITIEYEGKLHEKTEIRIVNITGQIVFHASGFRKKINIENLRSGIYFLLLQSDSVSYTRKFIKQ
ncbi:MAG: T9SS type A sorting domain-containing protein [Bacteroidales bacterium]